MHSVGLWWMWAGFFIFVATVLAVDTFLFSGKKTHTVSTREALSWTIVWVSCALIFNVLLWFYLNNTLGGAIAKQKALEFFTGYVIEESLSVDNMFVFLMIFAYFAVPPEYQRRVLLYGVWGAIILRLVIILGGTWLVSQAHWVLYLFGLFLVITGIKMLFFAKNKRDLEQNPLLRWLRNHIRLTEQFHAERFFIRRNRLWYATPLFLVLVLIEVSDLIFALDSIPSIFAVTQDPFIVVTSNIFAILGLRALFFLLANMEQRFYLLKYGIAILLTFVGIKMLIAPWVTIPIPGTLGIVITILVTTAILSMFVRPRRI